MPAFEMRFTAAAEDIDQLGHVNNAVWVRWMESIASAHWESTASPEHLAAYIWMITRHEIDYMRALLSGQSVTARTWGDDIAKGARNDRIIEFTGDDGILHVRARSTWAMIDKASGRPVRIRDEIVAPFRL